MFEKECKLTQVNKRTPNSAKYSIHKELLDGRKRAEDGK